MAGDGEGQSDAYTERVMRAAQRLRELEASGVGIREILSGDAGKVFIRDDCGGDLDVVNAAFALVHAPKGPEGRAAL